MGKRRSGRKAAARRLVPLALCGVMLALQWQGLAARQMAGDDLSQPQAPYVTQTPSPWQALVTGELTGLEVSLPRAVHLPATDSLLPEQESAPEDGGDATEQTLTANSNTLTGTIHLNNNTDRLSVDIEALCSSALSQRLRPAQAGPQILIMHTHGSEAYTMAGADQYRETDNARTDDPNYNMLRIGEEMKAVFESMGLSVIHDTTLYDYPTYSGSYGRSLKGIRHWLEQYPTIAVVLDVHRDALIAADGTVYKAVTEVAGEKVAQVMLVCGTNDGGLTHPGWRDNLTLAAQIQLRLTDIEPTLARPVNLRSQRFNQHMTAGSLLVEVGTSGNTLQEALRGARLFAQAAGEVYLSLVEEA